MRHVVIFPPALGRPSLSEPFTLLGRPSSITDVMTGRALGLPVFCGVVYLFYFIYFYILQTLHDPCRTGYNEFKFSS